MDEPEDSEIDQKSAAKLAREMFFFRKMVIFFFISIIIIIVLFMALVIIWSMYKEGDVPTMDSLVSIANVIASMFEHFMGGES